MTLFYYFSSNYHVNLITENKMKTKYFFYLIAIASLSTATMAHLGHHAKPITSLSALRNAANALYKKHLHLKNVPANRASINQDLNQLKHFPVN